MRFLLSFLLFVYSISFGQRNKSSIDFTLSIPDSASQQYHVQLKASGFKQEFIEFKMPVWTPGYYQILDYAKYVSEFKAVNEKGEALKWEQTNKNTWKITKGKKDDVVITYLSKATVAFVANSLLDANHGYIMPAGVFMYPKDHLSNPIKLNINNYPQWKNIATGLERAENSTNTFIAPDFDTFYDSPILLGNLEELPSFKVEGIPHYFIGYQLGNFDKQQFMSDMEKIVTAAISVIGDIPYKQYTFLAIGSVPGGIEHLNSTGFGFSSKDFDRHDRLVRMYNFLSHEYFHHYNVKRIRPIELGPFDYDKGSPTTMLWISEGFNNYYDELIVKRAGIVSAEEYLKEIEGRINSYENKPGKLFQTASDASFNTWADGPFGRQGDDAYKTISVYEKGSLLGLILDLEIRQSTQNLKSLDDVMRSLYQEYYQKKKRGFTEKEFREVAEKTAGKTLNEFFDYVNTTRELDLKKFLGYAGLELTQSIKGNTEPYFGITARQKNDTLKITKVEYESPAWKLGLRSNQIINSINNQKATNDIFNSAIQQREILNLEVNGKALTIEPALKKEKAFQIKLADQPNELQRSILRDWLHELH